MKMKLQLDPRNLIHLFFQFLILVTLGLSMLVSLGIDPLDIGYLADHYPKKVISVLVVIFGSYGLLLVLWSPKMDEIKNKSIQISLEKYERDLLVTGLQALHRERASAWNSQNNHAAMKGETAVPREAFGIDEVTALLDKMGAGPC